MAQLAGLAQLAESTVQPGITGTQEQMTRLCPNLEAAA